MNYITFVGLRHNNGESNQNGLKIVVGDLHGHKNLQLVNEEGKIVGSMIGSQNKFNELINLGVDEEYLTLQKEVNKEEIAKKEVKDIVKYEEKVYIVIKIGDNMKEEMKIEKEEIKEMVEVVKKDYPRKTEKSVYFLALRRVLRRKYPDIDRRKRNEKVKALMRQYENEGEKMQEEIIKFKDHYNERISKFEQTPEQREQNKCTVVTYYASKCWGREKRTEIDINKENIDFIERNITRNNNKTKEVRDQLEDLLNQKGEFDPYWVELYKHQTDYKAFVTEENEIYEIVGTGNDTVTYYAGNRTFKNVKVEYRGKMPRNMYFWKAKLSKGTNIKEDDTMKKINEMEKAIKETEEILKIAKETRDALYVKYCCEASDISEKFTAEVIKHKFSNELCVMEGYATFTVEIKDTTTGEVVFRDNLSCYHEHPILIGGNNKYCCGRFKLNESAIAWHLIKSRKGCEKHFINICVAIEQYIAKNNLGCSACE